MNTTVYNIRHLARVVLECATPIAVGSGLKDILTDAKVIVDANGLPYIPGTSIAGVFNHGVHGVEDPLIWGFQEGDKGCGSRIIFTDAKLVDADGRAIDGLRNSLSDFASNYLALPVRQHVRINEKGTAEKGGKFDNEIVPAGSRFVFEIEIIGNDAEDNQTTLNALRIFTYSPSFRLGSNTRSGLGELKVVCWKERVIDLADESQREDYIQKSSSLVDERFWENAIVRSQENQAQPDWVSYELTLTPDDLFSFGSGFGDEDVDDTPLYERHVDWTNGTGKFTSKRVVIPASSVKGAIAHRVAFHYNRLKGAFADKIQCLGEAIDDYNVAVTTLFGKQGIVEKGKMSRGSIIISDCLMDIKPDEHKILNHVSIDPFTGGAIDGALYNEKVVFTNERISLRVYVEKKALADADVANALDQTLNDVCTGMLPLGGAVNRGHGVFSGTCRKLN